MTKSTCIWSGDALPAAHGERAMKANYECCVSFLQSKPSLELAMDVVRLEAARQAARDDCELCAATGLIKVQRESKSSFISLTAESSCLPGLAWLDFGRPRLCDWPHSRTTRNLNATPKLSTTDLSSPLPRVANLPYLHCVARLKRQHQIECPHYVHTHFSLGVSFSPPTHTLANRFHV